jgi:chromosome partitioning protein
MCAMKLAVVNQKGGVGKTTTAVNLAAILGAEFKKRVLLIDLDPQGHASLVSGDLRDQSKRPPIYRVLVEEESVASQVQKTAFGFDLLAGGIGNAVTEMHLTSSGEGAEALAVALRAVEDDYDVVILDCPPSLGQLMVCALGAADKVIVPMPLQPLPMDGLEQLLGRIKRAQSINPKLQLGAIFVTNTDERTRVAKLLRAELDEHCADVLLEQVVRRNTSLAEATFKRRPVTLYDPGSPGAQDYSTLAAELVQRGLA